MPHRRHRPHQVDKLHQPPAKQRSQRIRVRRQNRLASSPTATQKPAAPCSSITHPSILTFAPNLSAAHSTSGPHQFSEGISAWSTTITHTGPFPGCSFSPICSCTAVKSEGAASSVALSRRHLPSAPVQFEIVVPLHPRLVLHRPLQLQRKHHRDKRHRHILPLQLPVRHRHRPLLRVRRDAPPSSAPRPSPPSSRTAASPAARSASSSLKAVFQQPLQHHHPIRRRATAPSTPLPPSWSPPSPSPAIFATSVVVHLRPNVELLRLRPPRRTHQLLVTHQPQRKPIRLANQRPQRRRRHRKPILGFILRRLSRRIPGLVNRHQLIRRNLVSIRPRRSPRTSAPATTAPPHSTPPSPSTDSASYPSIIAPHPRNQSITAPLLRLYSLPSTLCTYGQDRHAHRNPHPQPHRRLRPLRPRHGLRLRRQPEAALAEFDTILDHTPDYVPAYQMSAPATPQS